MEATKPYPIRDKIIPVPPKKDSNNSKKDRQAISTLLKLLSDHGIDSKIAMGDTTPNYDGIIEIEDGGKLEVQVKYKLFADGKPIKYSIKDAMLSHCENCTLPFIFILVDPIKDTAYWEYISRGKSIELYNTIKTGKHSISHKFLESNIIRRDQTEFIESWRSYCKINHYKLHTFEENEEELKKKEEILKKTEKELLTKKKQLKKFNKAIGETRPIFSEIHRFLDIYNGLLDREFFAYKATNFESMWKVGLAYSKYDRDSTQFIFYSISHQKNDVQIKRVINDEIEDIADDTISYNNFKDSNPIRNNPIEYSYQLIQDGLVKIFKMKDLYYLDDHLADEYLMRFIQKFHVLLGMDPNNEKYSLEDFENRFKEYIPIWLDQAIKISGIDFYNSTNKPAVVLEHFIERHKIDKEAIQIITGISTQLYSDKNYSVKLLPYGSAHSSIDYVRYIIQFCKDIGKTHINKAYTITKESIKQKPEATRHNIRRIFEQLPETYTRFVNQYFPLLSIDLRYYHDYDRLVVSINSAKNDNFDLTIFFLKAIESDNNQTHLDVYYSDELPESLKGSYGELLTRSKESKIVLDNITYQLKGSHAQAHIYDFTNLPQRDVFYATLLKHFENYFKAKATIKKEQEK